VNGDMVSNTLCGRTIDTSNRSSKQCSDVHKSVLITFGLVDWKQEGSAESHFVIVT